MKIVAVPITEDLGLLSPVSPDFASAPMFLLVDSATLAFRSIPNTAQRRKERGCDPCAALEDTIVDLLIVDRIERDTIDQLASRGMTVHCGARGTAANALAALMGGRLPALPAAPARAG
jgi:predicted Fe-Mo cluster-binding NifX family protein